MMPEIKDCPFCGYEEVTVSVLHNKNFLYTGIVICNHCQASGSLCGGEETETEARQAAIENWNLAYRPNRYKMATVRTWNNFWRRVRGDN